MTVTHIGLWTYAGGNAVECHLYPRNDALFRAGSNAVLLEPAIARTADNIATVEGRNEIRLTRPVAIQPGEYVPLCHWHQGDNPTSNLFPIMGVSVPMAEPSGRHCWMMNQDALPDPQSFPPEDFRCGSTQLQLPIYVLGER